jgi:hypothetical protein
MGLRYYIVDLVDGLPLGTNDKVIAESYALSEDAFVIDTETNEWLSSSTSDQIKEVKE